MTLQDSAQVFLEMISADQAGFKGKIPAERLKAARG